MVDRHDTCIILTTQFRWNQSKPSEYHGPAEGGRKAWARGAGGGAGAWGKYLLAPELLQWQEVPDQPAMFWLSSYHLL